jgi:hypothetical protein
VDSNGWRIRPPAKIRASSIAAVHFDFDFSRLGDSPHDDTLVGLWMRSSLVTLVAGVWKKPSLGSMVLELRKKASLDVIVVGLEKNESPGAMLDGL